MAITREAKEQSVQQLKDDFSTFKLAVLTDYRGLTVAELKELRRNLAAEGISYRVSKNTLLRIATAETPALKEIDPATFTGPMALAIGAGDEVAPARVIFQYAKDHEALEIVGALTPDGRLLTPAEVKTLALMPSREQLLGSVVGTIATPLTGFVGVMGAQVRSIVNVINAISKIEEK